MWESLHNVEGDGNFCDSDFRLCHPSQKPPAASQPSAQQQQMQIDQVIKIVPAFSYHIGVRIANNITAQHVPPPCDPIKSQCKTNLHSYPMIMQFHSEICNLRKPFSLHQHWFKIDSVNVWMLSRTIWWRCPSSSSREKLLDPLVILSWPDSCSRRSTSSHKHNSTSPQQDRYFLSVLQEETLVHET